MARTYSNMLSLGVKAPEFALPNVVSRKNQSFSELKGDKGTVVMFICNHCPFVIHVLDEIIKVAQRYGEQGIGFIAISSNDISAFPQDAPAEMKKLAEEKFFPFPYLYDEDQSIAKAYHAACTPDFYLFNSQVELVYRGRFDESTPGNNVPVTGDDLKNALDNLLNGNPISTNQFPSIGCNIKWKA